MSDRTWKQCICSTVVMVIGIGIGVALMAWLDPGDQGWSPRHQFLAGFIAISLLVLAGLPLMAHRRGNTQKELRGLGLPRGSIRGMLALWMVGSYLLFLVFVPILVTTQSADLVDRILTAFGPLVGAVLAFYFAGRSATPSPNRKLADLSEDEREELKREVEAARQ